MASKSQFDAAIAEWKKLLTNSPADGAVYNSIGDLQLKRNATKDAIASYLRAADAFRTEGATLKAIAAYKKLLKVDPRCLEIYLHLGHLNAERGLASSAVAEYSTLARYLQKDGKFKEALEVYRRILKLEPSDHASKKQAQELASRLKVDLEQFLSLPDTGPILGKAGVGAPGANQPAPSSREAQLAEASRNMEQGLLDDAESMLSQLLSCEPGDPEVCQLLARLHLKRGELPIALNEYQFLAGAALRADDHQLAESLIREYLLVDPSCVPLLEILGAVYEKRDDPYSAAEEYGKALQLLLKEPDPDMPTLPAELYERIKELAPESDLLHQFTDVFEPATAPEAPPASDPDDAPTPVASTEEDVPAKSPAFEEFEEVAPWTPFAPDSDSEPEPDPRLKFEHVASSSEPEAHLRPELDPEPQPVAAASAHQSTQPPGPSEAELEARFVLGKAYRDMGLLSEAMEEFRVSVTSDVLFLDSCLELAYCLRERGMSRRAIACLEHAINDSRCHEEQALTLRYELGLLYEAEGLFDRALRVFETMPTYQDVAKRIEWIKGGGQKAETPPAGLSGAVVHAGQALAAPPGRDRKKRRISYL